jgi:energy-coupling factor transporter ATP-binding protein EcfA2
MSTLEIKDIAAIHDLEIDIPEDSGGVLVFKGRNGAGKSACLEIVRGLLAGKGKLNCRDGAAKGKASGFGRDVSVSTSTRYRGELEEGAAALEGRFDFSDLVLPEEKEPEKRDRTRIRALLSLTGVKAEAALFYDLVGGQINFEKLVPSDQVKKADDLVELGAKVAAALHAEARKKESDAEYALSHAQACRAAAGEIDTKCPVDLDALHQKSVEASSELSRLTERKKQADDNAEAIKEAERKLEQVQTTYTGLGVKEASGQFDAATSQRVNADAKVEEIRRQLADAEKAQAAALQQQTEARAAYDAAVGYEKLVGLLQQQINAASGGDDAPSDLDLKLAQKTADTARLNHETAVKHHGAALKAKEAEQYEEKAKDATKAAESLREAARSVDQVLTTKLPKGPLRAEKGRLVLDTERGEGVPFDECSDGEKYRVALPYGIASVGAGGYLALIQAGWQDLDMEHRAEIAELCRQSKVWLLTGEVADGDLRAEEFSLEA